MTVSIGNVSFRDIFFSILIDISKKFINHLIKFADEKYVLSLERLTGCFFNQTVAVFLHNPYATFTLNKADNAYPNTYLDISSF